MSATTSHAGVPSAQPVTGPYVSLGTGLDLPQDQSFELAPQLGRPQHTIFLDPGAAG